jgi:hypothetical protein
MQKIADAALALRFNDSLNGVNLFSFRNFKEGGRASLQCDIKSLCALRSLCQHPKPIQKRKKKPREKSD